MGKFFSNKRYDDIMKEFEAEEGWEEYESEDFIEEDFVEESVEDDFDFLVFDDEDEVAVAAEPVKEAKELAQTAVFTAATVEAVKQVKAEQIKTEPALQVTPQKAVTYDFDDDTEFFDMDDVPEYTGRRNVVEEEEDDEEDDKIAGIISFKTLQLALAVICLCLVGVFGFSAYSAMKADEQQVAANYEMIGNSLMDVEVLGGDGLLALKDAMLEAQRATEPTEESSEYQETNTKADVQVKLVMTSVQKDLKIKFTNKKTGKLIANIPFEVEVKTPNGKTSTWTDDDRDGIIYMKNIASGKYTVTLVPLEDEKYEKYLMIASAEKVTVKENIEYQKVDVSAEIKGENEIDVSKEEQNVVQTPVEEVIEDTVAWVESTKTYVGDNYKEISKSDIQAPSASIASLNFVRTEQLNPLTELGSDVTTDSGADTEQGTESAEPSTESTEATEASTEAPTEPSEESAEPSAESTEATEATSESTEFSTEPTEETSESTEASMESSEPLVPVALATKDGAAVFVKDGDSYRAATSADYNVNGIKFYIKEQGYKYTGWNTIDGELYYFDANGKAVTGEQVIRGVIYHFDSKGKLASGNGKFGIDVSSHNGSIDWNAVAKSGVEYVIIRCGYRGYGSGVLVEDSRYRTNIKGATNAGLKVGVYFFSQALDEIEAVEEASMVLNSISGYQITFPIFLDVEYSNTSKNGRADGLSVSQRTAVCNAFCKTIVNAGYRAGVYANKDWLNNHIDPSKFSSSTKIWLAQYAKTPNYSGRYEMWQYSSTGSISGIKGNVDLNMSYLGY